MLLELIFEFEEKFGISVPNDFPTPDTVGELVSAVDAMRAKKAEAAN
jgi:acyl carrier protein